MPSSSQLRWFAACVLYLSSALNYLDRAVLSALAPTIIREFHLTGQEFGLLISAFSLTYTISAPLMGILIDRIGLTLGATIAVGAWSAVGAATGFVGSFSSLLVCRGALGIAEAGGIPATGKAGGIYLTPHERALGAAVSQLGLTLGIVGAPLLTAWLSAQYGWRWTFVAAGSLGFVWIPL